MEGLRSYTAAVLCMAAGACSTSFHPSTCEVDPDCGPDFVCERRGGEAVCVDPAEAPIVLGQSAPATGNNQALGIGMRTGIELAMDAVNESGGVRGRQIQLVFRDDGYDPIQAEANARVLVDAQQTNLVPKCPNTATPVSNGAVPPELIPVSTTAIDRGPEAVLAVIGSVGTPTMVRAAPVAIESGTLFFGAFTGAGTLLRDTTAGPCAKYIFNIRSSYKQEAIATLELFDNRSVVSSSNDYRNLISFDQNDTFGNAGYAGLVDAFIAKYGGFPSSADPTTPIARFRYTRNDNDSVPAQAVAAEAYLANLLTAQASGQVHVGIMMTDTYGAGVTFIQHLRDWQFDGNQTSLGKDTRLFLHFSNVSFVGPDALAQGLVALGNVTTPSGPMPYTNEVAVSQVVPNYYTDQSDVVRDYKAAVSAAGLQPGFTSLEGYIAMRVFTGGLLAHEGPFTPGDLVGTFENLPDLNLGIGATAGFGSDSHQYSNSVWGTRIMPDGKFSDLYFWTLGSPIQFFQ